MLKDMHSPYISPDWTIPERQRLIRSLLRERDVGNVTRGWMVDIMERIRFLQTMPPEFLETNRADILNGNPNPDNNWPTIGEIS